MKEYIKPELLLVSFASENVANQGTAYDEELNNDNV